MVRNYKSKNARKQWSTEDMEKAMEEVRLKHISISRASKTYNVPKETLRQCLKKPQMYQVVPLVDHLSYQLKRD